MPGGNPPRGPPAASFAHSHHRRSRWESSSSAAAHKSKLSPNPTATPPNNRDPNKRPVATKPEGPSPRLENPNAIPQPRLENPNAIPQPRLENPNAISQPRLENPKTISQPRPVFPFAEPPPPSYGFHMLERRSIVLADGSVRSYFALPPDYENFARMSRPGLRPEFHGPHGFGLDRPPFPMSPEFLGQDARGRNNPEHWNAGPESRLKRKFGEDERGGRDDGFERQRQQLLQYGNADAPGPSGVPDLGRGGEERAPKNMRLVQGNVSKLKHSEVDQNALKKAFFHFVKLVYETTQQRKKYLADGKQGPMWCLPCGRFACSVSSLRYYIRDSNAFPLCDLWCFSMGVVVHGIFGIVLVATALTTAINRSSKDFPDIHGLIMHAYDSDNADSVVDHLAFHKALCILMGWNYSMPPDNTKAYRNFSADDAEANQNDLIMWPPTVLIHNTITGKGRDGRIEGIGNRTMDSILRDLGFASGKSMSLHNRDGFLGMHAVKFSADESGLKDALKLADYFEKEKHGRKDWARIQPPTLSMDDEHNPNLVKFDPKSREKKRVFYGHLATVADLDKVNFDIRKRVSIVSMREYKQSQ